MNYQNIPRSNKVVKRAFVPKLDALFFADYGQIEARLAAYYMHRLGWSGLLDDIVQGVDVHSRMARIIYGLPEQTPPSSGERDRAKTMFFGMLYGAGPKRVREILGKPGEGRLNVNLSQARAIRTRFRDALPGLDLLQDGCERRIRQRGYLELFTGRRLEMEPFGEHKLPNALIQGTAAEFIKRALVKVDDATARMEAHLVSNIHDEVFLDSPERELPWLYNALPNLMDEPEFSSVVPIVVEMEYSLTNWADKAPYPPQED